MTEISRPWDGLILGDATESPYDAATEFARILSSVAGAHGLTNKGGICANEENELEITGAASPIQIASGSALVWGTWYNNSAAMSMAISTPVGATRIDRIVLRKLWASQTIRITKIAGIEGGAAPPLTQSAGSTWDIPLARVSITVGGVITITDERVFISGGVEPGTITDTEVAPAAGIQQSKIDNTTPAIDADMVDSAHAGTAPDNVLLLDGSGNAEPDGYVTSVGMRAHRHPYANNRHIESGKAVSSNSAGVTVSFTTHFASSPVVILTIENSPYDRTAQLDASPGVGSFVFSVYLGVNRENGLTVHWIAEGESV
jgi:hypothetical protein